MKNYMSLTAAMLTFSLSALANDGGIPQGASPIENQSYFLCICTSGSQFDDESKGEGSQTVPAKNEEDAMVRYGKCDSTLTCKSLPK